MADLLEAFNGAIPVGALRARQFHNRVNKLVKPDKIKPINLLKGGDSIVIEKLEHSSKSPPTQKTPSLIKTIDKQPAEMVKIDTVQEVSDEPKPAKPKRKYRRRKSTK